MGVDDYVDLGDPASLDVNTAVTYSMWIKPALLVDDASIISKRDPSSDDGATQITLTASGKLDFNFVKTGTVLRSTANSVLSVGQWYHVVLVHTWGSGAGTKFYVNGVPVAMSAWGPGTGDEIMATNSSNRRLGYSANAGLGMKGLIDDVRIYNRALSADEIKRLYNLGGTVKLNSSTVSNNSLQNGLVGWWTFDGKDVSGVQAYDRSGTGNRGTLTSGPARTIGKIGQGLACPAPELIEAGGPSAPDGIFPGVCEPLREVVPAACGVGPCQLEGLCPRLTGDGAWHGQPSGRQGRLRAGRARLLWARVSMMGRREERRDGRGDEGRMPEGLQRTGLFGVDGVEAVHRGVEPEAECHLPAHAGEGGPLPWPEAWGEMGQETHQTLAGSALPPAAGPRRGAPGPHGQRRRWGGPPGPADGLPQGQRSRSRDRTPA